MKPSQLLCGLCLLLLSAFAPARAQVFLAFKLKPGTTYEYTFDFDIRQEIQGQKVNMRIKSVYDMSVAGAPNNALRLCCTYRAMSMAMDVPGLTMAGSSEGVADTTVSPDGMLSQMMHAMIDKSFYLTVTPEGAITAVDSVSEMTDAIFRDIHLPEERLAGMRAGYEQQFNADAVRESFTQSFNIYPNKLVKLGDSWKIPMESKSKGITGSATYTVKAIKGDLVLLDVVSDLEMAGPVSMKGTQNGNLTLEAATGLTRTGELHQTFNGDLVMNSILTYTGKVK